MQKETTTAPQPLEYTPLFSGPCRTSGMCVCVCTHVRLLTQVHVGGLGSLGVRRALVHSVQQFLLHLRHRVAVEALHRHLRRVLVLRVHAVQRLQGVRGHRVSHTLAGALTAERWDRQPAGTSAPADTAIWDQ